MQAAKAKAAAKQAALKKKQAAAAAAAQLEAAAKAASVPPAVSRTSAPTRARPSVTQYWADSASSQLGEGGGIQRIGFDQGLWEQAVREIILEPTKAQWPAYPPPAEGEDPAEESEGEVKEEVEVVDKAAVNKEDVALIIRELEVDRAEAELALRSCSGSLVPALSSLVSAS